LHPLVLVAMLLQEAARLPGMVVSAPGRRPDREALTALSALDVPPAVSGRGLADDEACLVRLVESIPDLLL
jgi:hypothetical protein